MKQDLMKCYQVPSKKIIVINNPIDSESIYQKSFYVTQLLDNKKINLLSVGRLDKVKGYDLLLEAMKQLDDRFHLTIIGQGSEEFNLQHLVKKLGLKSKVSFLDFQDNPYCYMRQADIMLLSSRYEGFPNVVLEANACGTPVVAFNCPGGTGEIIKNGVNGFLVECGDIEKLSQTIIQAVHQKWDSKKIMDFVFTRYNIGNIIKQYESIL